MADGWIQTYTGVEFTFTEPVAEQVRLADIAHALAHTCRYAGHCGPFYSVAEHSVHVAERVERRAWSLGLPEAQVYELARAALLHDAAEAYIGDFPSPLKRHLGAPVRELEARIMTAVDARFGVPAWARRHPLIHAVDFEMLLVEAPQLLEPLSDGWRELIVDYAYPVAPLRRWSWLGRLFTKRRFLAAAARLGVQ